MLQKIKKLFILIAVALISFTALTATCSMTSLGATVKVSQVKDLKATAGYNEVKLTWTKISGAKYTVYSYNPTTKEYKKLKNVSENSCTVSGLKQGTTYHYSVQGYKKVSGETYYGKKSATVKTTTKVSKPGKVENLTGTSTADTVKLTWKKQSGVKYTVYSCNAAGDRYTVIANISSNTYTVKKLKSNSTYRYSVRAYKTVNDTRYYGPYSSVLKIKTKDPLTLSGANSLYKEALEVYMDWIYSCTYTSDTVYIRRKLNNKTCRFALVEHPEVKNMENLKSLLSSYFDESIYKNELYFYKENGGKLYYYAEGGIGEPDVGVRYYTQSLKKVSNTKYTYTLKPTYYKDYTGTRKESYNLTLIKRDGKWIFTDRFYPCTEKIK